MLIEVGIYARGNCTDCGGSGAFWLDGTGMAQIRCDTCWGDGYWSGWVAIRKGRLILVQQEARDVC